MRSKVADRMSEVRFFPEFKPSAEDLTITFRGGKELPVYGWYPYAEGFSGEFVERLIEKHGLTGEDDTILDPFVGCGTTAVAATLRGIDSISVDANPAMCFVTRVKTRFDIDPTVLRSELYAVLNAARQIGGPGQIEFFQGSRFFPPDNLRQVLQLRDAVLGVALDAPYVELLMLALISIAVRVSNMARHTDLRYRTRPNSSQNVFDMFQRRVLEYLSDLERIKPQDCIPRVMNADIRRPDQVLVNKGEATFFVTSPPYLNGTNYVRNTKLELAILGLVKTRDDLVNLHKRLLVGGINSVTAEPLAKEFPFVGEVSDQLAKVAYDRRIPRMVDQYFSDMYLALSTIDSKLAPGSEGYIVVGDSRYAGIHVPTDSFVARLCVEIGWSVVEAVSARPRRSKDGGLLRDSVIRVEKC